jgi:hypothetical protein
MNPLLLTLFPFWILFLSQLCDLCVLCGYEWYFFSILQFRLTLKILICLRGNLEGGD